MFQEGAARFIEAGSRLRFEMHYYPNGREETDRSQLGVWLARSPIHYAIRSGLVNDMKLQIPPYEPNYESVAERRSRSPASC